MQVNGMQVRSTYLLSEGEVLSVCLDDSAAESHEMEASGTVPEILYEDADVIAGMEAGRGSRASVARALSGYAGKPGCSPIFRAGESM